MPVSSAAPPIDGRAAGGAAPSRVETSPSPASPIRFASERDLWQRRSTDAAAREELVRRYLPLARKLASRYRSATEPYEDLVGVAHYGLLNAVDRFDPARGTPFSGYAAPTILGEIKRHVRDRSWTVRLPRGIHDLLGEIEKASERLRVELQRSPSPQEIAERLGVDVFEILEALDADHNRRTLSFDLPIGGDDENASMEELIGQHDAGFELAEDRFAIAGALECLDPREREMLRLRFEEDMTQSEIAERAGCSQMHVSRLLRRALGKLRAEIGAGGTERIP
jgi:RNA polymerase sigma-B factor